MGHLCPKEIVPLSAVWHVYPQGDCPPHCWDTHVPKKIILPAVMGHVCPQGDCSHPPCGGTYLSSRRSCPPSPVGHECPKEFVLTLAVVCHHCLQGVCPLPVCGGTLMSPRRLSLCSGTCVPKEIDPPTSIVTPMSPRRPPPHLWWDRTFAMGKRGSSRSVVVPSCQWGQPRGRSSCVPAVLLRPPKCGVMSF